MKGKTAYMPHKARLLLPVLLFIAVSIGAWRASGAEDALPPAFAGMSQACPTSSSNCLVAYFGDITEGLCVDTITVVATRYWKDSREPRPLPRYARPKNRPGRLSVRRLLFMQDSASGLFTDRRYDVIDLAKDLKTGRVKTGDLPSIEVWQDTNGRIWTMSHRRTLAMIMAGLDQVPVRWADESTVLQNRSQLTSTNGGKKITVWLADNVGMVVKNDGSCGSRTPR